VAGLAVALGLARGLGFDLGIISRFGFGVGVLSGASEIGAGRRCAVMNNSQQTKQSRPSACMSI
jgi:hypothetical protein